MLRIYFPVLGLLFLWVFSGQIIDILEAALTLRFVNKVVFWISTGLQRFLSAAVIFLTLWVIFRLIAYVFSSQLQPRLAVLIILLGVSAGFWADFGIQAFALGAALGMLVFLNAVPTSTLEKVFARRRLRPLIDSTMFFGVGFVEFLAPRPYWIFLRRKIGKKPTVRDNDSRSNNYCYWPGLAVVSMLCSVLISFENMSTLGRAIFLSNRAEIIYGDGFSFFGRNDVSRLVIQTQLQRLYFCGNGLKYLGVLDIAVNPPNFTSTDIPTGGSQFCTKNPAESELIVFDAPNRDLLVADDKTLEIKRKIFVEFMPLRGEVLLALSAISESIVVAYENVAGSEDYPIKVFGTHHLNLQYELAVTPGFVTVHPNLPILYVNDFRGNTRVKAYDLVTGELIAESTELSRADRMVVDPARNELLVTAPSKGQILVFDAENLSSKPPIGTIFGARGIEIDHSLQLLFVSSLVTNKIDIVSLATRVSLRREWLGPWLRDIVVDEKNSKAYVSSRYGIYRVDYQDITVPSFGEF